MPPPPDRPPSSGAPKSTSPAVGAEVNAGADGDAGRVLLVDAANVVGSRPTGWWRDRPGAARRLVEDLRAAVADGRLEPPVVVVVEGAARAGEPEGEAGGVRVVHAPGSGDDRLVELAAATPSPVVLVSADRDLRRRAVAAGATTVGPGWLHARLGGRSGAT